MTRVHAFGRDTFASLANRNYRRYFTGQAISLIGTWMQSIAQSWLVLQMTGSGTALGLVVALQTLPVLLLGPYGGVVADRVDKRRLMIALQSMMGVLALVLGVLTVTGAVRLWQVFVLAFLLGLNNAFENPARQAFVLEMVGPQDLRNAVSLNSVLVNAARAVGPAVAGVLIATVGTGVCFLVNAGSFVAVVASLMRMDLSLLQPSPAQVRGKGQLREGLRYVRRTPELAVPLVMMAVIGCLAYEFQVVLPQVAKSAFSGNAQAYGFMTATMGIGAVIGGLWTAARGTTGLLRTQSRSTAFRGGHLACGHRTNALDGIDRVGPGRRGQRELPGKGQQHVATAGRPADARPGDGALVGGLSRVDPDRRPASPARSRNLRVRATAFCSVRWPAWRPGWPGS